MNIIRRSSCRLLWNGEVSEGIKPSRGLRQGDPLSLYLFVLCLERLGHWITSKVNEGVSKPLRALRGGSKVSHLFFADDLILLAQATGDQARCI